MNRAAHLIGTGLLLLSVSGLTQEVPFRTATHPAYDETLTIEALSELTLDESTLLVDVRLPEDFAADPRLIPGAQYRNPEQIELRSNNLPPDATIIVYCVKGRWVSEKVASIPAGLGMRVCSLEGGISA